MIKSESIDAEIAIKQARRKKFRKNDDYNTLAAQPWLTNKVTEKQQVEGWSEHHIIAGMK